MAAFRLNWLRERAFSSRHRSDLGKVVASPLGFYAGALGRLVGNDNSRHIGVKLKNGRTAYMNSFMSFYIFDEIFVQGVYDLELTPKTVIDVGANIGMFVLWAADRWPGVEIAAYEPEPDNYATLLKNISSNDLPNVKAFQAALTGNGQPITLFRHPTNSGGHSTVRRTGEALEVPGCSLEAALGQLPGGACDLLKVDCEGGEADIFRSMTPDQSSRIANIVYEPEPKLYSVPEMNATLNALRYETRDVQTKDKSRINSDMQGMIWAHH